MISSTELLERLEPEWDREILADPDPAIIAGWIWDYFEDYGQAPGHTIEHIYLDKVRAGLSDDRAGMIEEILNRASQDWDTHDGINPDYLLDQYRKHRRDRLREMAREALAEGDDSEAERLFQELQAEGPAEQTNPAHFIQSLSVLKEQRPERPPLLMKPWLRAGETNFLYAADGVGKTLFALLVSYLLGLREYDQEEAEIGEWQVKEGCGVLYIDGEMGSIDLTRQLQQFEWIGEQDPEREIHPLCAPDYQRATDQILDLSQRPAQRSVERWLEDQPDYRLVVLDSVTTLFGLENESDNSEWSNKVGPFVQSLRARGVAQLILHHEGKNGDLRGASAMRAMASNVFRLTDAPEKKDGEAWFNLEKKKQRDSQAGFQPFSLRFVPLGQRTEWQTGGAERKKGKKQDGLNPKTEAIIAELVRGSRTQKDIANAFQVKPPYVHETKRKAKEQGYLDENGNPTEQGQKLAEQHDSPEPGAGG